MKILIGCLTMAYLSGSPLYHYELARELKRMGHDVDLVSEWEAPNTEKVDKYGWRLREQLEKEGVGIIQKGEQYHKKYDLMLMSEPTSKMYITQKCPVINIIHSEYDCETPILDNNIVCYVCIRPTIAMHIVSNHNIPFDMVKVIYNGIDRKRFSKATKQKRDYKLIIAPCTLDKLREKFLNHLISIATDKQRVKLIGMDCGAELRKSKYVEIVDDTFEIEKEMKKADVVAGILLGRVNLEARSCGVESWIFNPETLEKQVYYPSEFIFDTRHNIKNVAEQFINLYNKISL